ncbi:hypothetical protein [Cellulomonas sp. Root137]|uniref:hypothetical protein n=1 Tax=Cellulomonas sp. Root137 TaxID=1736459 RepID=UPI0006F6F303|nr:hypothetical protein [Cellulomonas sp. Root137]KQY41872.1 hypothetical protein ASD18_19740 [Cellulomonas sp. Root137]
MHSSQYARSTGLLIWGIVLLVLGQAVWSNGQQSALLDSLTSSGFLDTSSDGQTAIVIGALMALVGLILLILGVVRLSTNVDMAALVAARKLAAKEADDIKATQKRLTAESDDAQSNDD